MISRQVRLLRIVVASPGDVQGERDGLPELIEELNRGVAADRGLRLELSRWETDTYPGFHADGPQGGIDPILKIEDCDLLMGIFWRRFGTPTKDAGSGTEHEIKLAYEAWRKNGSPQLMVYFNQKAYSPKSKEETDQWGSVLEFRRNFPKEGLWWPYKGKTQFIVLVRNHLTQFVRNLKRHDPAVQVGPIGGQKLTPGKPAGATPVTAALSPGQTLRKAGLERQATALLEQIAAVQNAIPRENNPSTKVVYQRQLDDLLKSYETITNQIQELT